MKGIIRNSTILLPTLALLSLAQATLADSTRHNERHTVIAKSGDAAPEGGNYSIFSFFNANLNERGTAAFDSVVFGATPAFGVFAGDGKRTSTVAMGTSLDGSDPKSGMASNPFIINDGDVVFNGGPLQIFKSDGRRFIPLLQPGQTVRGEGTVTSLLGDRIVNGYGVVATVANVSGGAATQALLRFDGPRVVTIASTDIAPPTGGAFTALLNIAMNDRGEVAFNAEMAGGSADDGVFLGEGGRLVPVLVANQIAPGGGTVLDCGAPQINARGQATTLCDLTGGVSSGGLFLGDGRETVAVALNGQPAPTGADFQILESHKINNRSEVAFLAQLTDGTSGIFMRSGKHTTSVAVSGKHAPGTTGKFQSFGNAFRLGNDGRVAFIAALAPGVGGVNSSNNMGIWVGTSEADLKLLVRTGDVVDGSVLTSLPISDISTQHFDMNEEFVLWRGNFGDAVALVRSRIRDFDNGREDEH
jgi:hypothetical protein